MIEHWRTRYVVDTKLGHSSQLSSPFEVIEFESERGKGMWAAVGVVRCSRFTVSVMHHWVTGMCCGVLGVGRGLGRRGGRRFCNPNLSDLLRPLEVMRWKADVIWLNHGYSGDRVYGRGTS